MESVATPKPKSRIAPEGVIIRDINCVVCDYNLRGLDIDSRCPECGTPMRQAILGTHLKFADPQWLAQLADGANWIWNGIVLLIITLSASMLAFQIAFGIEETLIKWGYIDEGITAPTSPSVFDNFLSSVFGIVLFGMLGAVWLLLLVGIWKMTTPEPNPDTPLVKKRLTERQDCVLAAIAASFFAIVAFPAYSHFWAFRAVYILHAFFLLRLMWVMLNLVHSWAKRMPESGTPLSTYIVILAWLLAETLTIISLFPEVSGFFYVAFGGKQLRPDLEYLDVMRIICALVAVVLTFDLVYGCRKHLLMAANQAKEDHPRSIDEHLAPIAKRVAGY